MPRFVATVYAEPMGFRLAPAGVALALVAAAPLPAVKRLDPTAAFQGDGATIKFDPACRDFTIDTLPSDPACAARVAAGEIAPSLAVAAQTAGIASARRVEAITILERSVVAHDHPATHYLLGNLLSTGNLRPNYAEAVRHLDIAARRGNPAAADLLADLIVAGKGAPRDMPRAIALYRQAMATGWPDAATKLAVVYVRGRLVPADPVLAKQILDAAAGAGDQRAARIAAVFAVADKSHNFQLLPADADAAVKVREYGAFENPDIPPSFGFDEAFRAVHDAPYDDASVLAQLERDGPRLTPPYRYELARRLAASDPERALRTYLVARMRMTYDALRCADGAAMQAVDGWDRVIIPDMKFAMQDLLAGNMAALVAPARAALAEEATVADEPRPWWVCRSGMAAMTAALSGKPLPLALKPASEWPALRARSRTGVENLVKPNK